MKNIKDLLKRTIIAIPLLLVIPYLWNNIFLLKQIIGICSIVMLFELSYNIIKAICNHFLSIYVGFCKDELNKIIVPEIKYISIFTVLLIGAIIVIRTSNNVDDTTLFELLKAISLITISDTLQYIFGKLYGNKIFDNKTIWFSPNKTYEGYIFGGIVTVLLGILFDFDLIISFVFVLGGIIGGILSSASKRSLNIKDWSNLLFSHGGFIDRCDGYIIPVMIILLMDLYDKN